MAVWKEELEKWLAESINADEAVRGPATRALDSAESLPGFAPCLLAICSTGPSDEVKQIAAATYLKNFIRIRWTTISLPERQKLREQLVEVLLRVDFVVLKQLIEAFRIVASHDFSGKKNTWEDLILALQSAVQNSDLLTTGTQPFYKTLNVLLAIQAITKPFQYFLDPTVAREAVPLLLERISKDLLVPLHGLFHHLVVQALNSKQNGFSQHEDALLVIAKSFHLAVGSHMPASILSSLGNWVEDILALLDIVVVSSNMSAPEQFSRLKIWKRCLQVCCTLVNRHRKNVDKFLLPMANAALKIVGDRTNDKASEIHDLQQRIISLAFDLLSAILETGPGWRLLSPQFSSLLENSIFPSLVMKEKDIVLWNEDEDEYLRKNLPSDLDESSALRDDLLTPTRSALNLLGLIATSKGPPTGGAMKKNAALKRKKGKTNNRGTAGELLVMPFLARFPLPPDGQFFESTVSYYGVLLAYGALQEFFKTQSSDFVEMVLTSRVFPLYSMASPSPYLLANANWLLGELATCLPEGVNRSVYDCLLKAMVAENVGGVSWKPVRVSAAAAVATLLEEDYKPVKWFPLFHAIVSSVKSGVEEAGHALQLLTTAAETGEEDITVHVPYLVVSVKDEISKCIPCPPETWPRVVELGFSAIAALAHNWDSGEPDDTKKRGEPLKNWNEGCTTIMNTYAELLQRAWICSNKEESELVSPAPSYLSDTSVILGYLVKYTSEFDISRLRVERLLQIWTDLIAQWNAWDEEEDLPVFDAIEEIIALNGRCPLQHFSVAEIPSPPAPPVPPRSILEGMAAFVSSAIEGAYSAATWRACRLCHSLLHSTTLSFEGESATKLLVCRFSEVAFRRLFELSSVTVPLAKPLVLVIASCYVGLPGTVEEVVLRVGGDVGRDMIDYNSFLHWAKAMATLASADADPGLALESELKLGVICLLKLLERLVADKEAEDIARKCFESLLDASVRLREVQELGRGEDGEESENEYDTEDNSDNDSEDDSDEGDEEEEEKEETEDEFLERYAETARELEEEAIDDVEGGTEEDGQEIELGVLALADEEKLLTSCLQTCGQFMARNSSVAAAEVVRKFTDKFPEFRCLFPSEYVQKASVHG